MTESDNKARTLAQRSTDRRVYIPPSLREFGTVGALTQAGTAAMVEFGITFFGMMYCQNRMDRQMC